MKLFFVSADNEVTGTLEIINGRPVGTGVGLEVAKGVKAIEPETFELVLPVEGDRYLMALRAQFIGWSRALTDQEVNMYRNDLTFLPGVDKA